MSQKYYCPICGKPSRLYMGRPRRDMLCNIHADMVINGDIKLNSDGSYVKGNNMPLDEKIIYPKNKCILCGKSSDDRLLCKDCFIKSIRVEQSLCLDNIDDLLKVYYKTKKECYLINDKHEPHTQLLISE